MDTTFISARQSPKDMRPLKKDVLALQRDVEVIKHILSEGKLTPWATKELAKARKQQRSSYVSHDDV